MKRLFVVSFVVLSLAISLVSAVVPFGAQTSLIDTERASEDTAGDYEAFAGNVTELDIFAFTTTQTWQGYFGNVAGTIQLADSNDRVMYNWTLGSPEGEVYATEDPNVIWTNIQCFNHTATNTTADDSDQRGETSLYGLNMTEIENRYNIAFDDIDGLNETFIYNGTGENGNGWKHQLFYTNNLEFTEGECLAMNVFGSTNTTEDGNFEEVLLYSPDSEALVFAAIIDEEDVAGFDGNNHDFEMLVLEDGHGTDVASRTYYFYVELE